MVERSERTIVIVTCEYAPFPGGIGTYSVELARALADAGCRVVVVGAAYGTGAAALPERVEHHLILRHHHVPPRAVPQLLAILRRLPAGAIVLAADIRSLLLVRMLQPLHRRRYRVMVHGSEASKFRTASPMFVAARNAYLAAELVAYNSSATRDIFRAKLGRPRREAITYLGVGQDWFEAPATSAFENADLAALPPGGPLFCSVGRLEPRKGHIETLTALALARDRHDMADPAYVIVGRAEDDDHARTIRDLARDFNVRIVMPGRLSVDDIKRVYRRAAAHLLFARALPGKIEGFGLVLLEAAAQACPSIATATGGIPEVLGDTGSLVDDGDVESFAAKLALYTGDAALRADRGAGTRERLHLGEVRARQLSRTARRGRRVNGRGKGHAGLAGNARASALLCGLGVFALPCAAQAQSHTLAVSATIRYDDNLYRVPAKLRKALPNNGEEVITYIAVRGGVATRIGVVAIDVEGQAGQRIHAYNPRFNALDYAGSASATYKTGQGEVDAMASYLHTPVSFDDTSVRHKTLRTTTDLNLVALRDLLGDFRAIGRVGYQRAAISSRELQANGTSIVRFSGGAGYFSPTGNSITLEYSQQRASGLATTRILTPVGLASYRSDFRETSMISYVDYHLTGITSLKGSLGYTWHDDRSVLDKDARGIQGDIALVWSPLPELVISPSFRSGFATESQVFSNGISVTSYGISASDTIFGKVKFNLGFSRENRRFRYDVQAPAPLALGRDEVTTRATAGLSYVTGSRFTLNLAYEHAQRQSTKVDFPYVGDAMTFSVTRAFGS